ncbi:efflux RND transporter periplasmic adaptor subunit [Alginatibacterium sediminis]|uniref:Efflux RND transporter periplasmic adaptor subunit n=1 Tax=Alginatibacterium sediminis TaxID=2164068 RepID=A0A420E960_9ALTE|nr:efflux RND transporter periplasmic adaptor subunit [Alginatibacterium sediminis]RKF15834.1 efflux RND transporter periplasmic adaptor subunit [Alginatibacterium sediminis]
MLRSVRNFFGARPYILSIVISVVVVLWMLSGQKNSQAEEATPEAAAEEKALTRVQVHRYSAQSIVQTLNLYGRTEALRQSTIGAEVAGRLSELLVERGAFVQEGDALARIDISNRQSQLKRAQALLEQRRIEYSGIQALNKKGFQGKASLAQARASLVDAQSLVESLTLDIDNTVIVAPFTGYYNHNYVEEGAYLGVGDPILQLTDTSEMVVRVDVSERDVNEMRAGLPALVKVMSGDEIPGVVSFVATVSNPATNTFKVEVLVDNSAKKLKAGVSAAVVFGLAEVSAIKVTPAVLALDDSGELGVKIVVDEHVQFVPAQLVRSEPDGAWLSGFDGDTDVIILGQGFVNPGEHVEAVSIATESQVTAQSKGE